LCCEFTIHVVRL